MNPDVEALYTSEHDTLGTDHRPAPAATLSDNDSIKRESPRTIAYASKSVTPVEAYATSPTAPPSSISGRTTISPAGTDGFRTPLSPRKRHYPDDAVTPTFQIQLTRKRLPPTPEPPDMRNTYRKYWPNVNYGYPTGTQSEAIMESGENIKQVVRAEMRRLEDENAAAIPDENFLSPAEWRPFFHWPNEFTTNQCTSLMRYFIEELGPWVSQT